MKEGLKAIPNGKPPLHLSLRTCLKFTVKPGVVFPHALMRVIALSLGYANLTMHAAYILITTMKGKAWEVTDKVAKVKGVKLAHLITGPYDVVAYVESEKPITEELKGILKEVHAIDGVEKTLTCVVIH